MNDYSRRVLLKYSESVANTKFHHHFSIYKKTNIQNLVFKAGQTKYVAVSELSVF